MCAKLPSQQEVSDKLLEQQPNDNALDDEIVAAIKTFLSDAFNWQAGDALPSLEDVFTMIDLSANTGHNLGARLTPRKLRAIRRLLIHRVFTVLDAKYRTSNDIASFLQKLAVGRAHVDFVTLNWDIVLEKHLESGFGAGVRIDYCIDAKPWNGHAAKEGPRLRYAKVHGSSNWVYCDNCKALYYDLGMKLSLKIKAAVRKNDLRVFDQEIDGDEFERLLEIKPSDRKCQHCKRAVTPHIATFSYRKSFRTHAFASTWHAAERILDQAKKWIFIGYSLPAADFEFKHILKQSQLKMAKKAGQKTKDIDVVLYKDPGAETRYRSFFGKQHVNVNQAGLGEYAKAMAAQVGETA